MCMCDRCMVDARYTSPGKKQHLQSFMGKHNGKSRSLGGLKVGVALVNRASKGGPNTLSNPDAKYRYTTDQPGLQSNLEANDLSELMDMAQLANRDFTAERGHVIVVSDGTVTAKDRERNLSQRQEAEARNAHRLRVPRRPAWKSDMTAEDIDAQERAAFVRWRQELARLEEEEKLVLTPFEKNLEVWRQLWRVLERSHIVIQVVDARDPLLYRSTDLEAFARELHPSKSSMLLLNKADLLAKTLRTAWANHFDRQGIQYVFWSAKAAAEGISEEDRAPDDDDRVKVYSSDELIDRLSHEAQAAVSSGGPPSHYGVTESHPGGRLMVGLTGYPNVGKSSTINALFGSKKTTVSATPGKTKHFQTLNITSRLTLVDCPGLVLPKYAASKAEMVAAGVIPIDRLTDVRTPVAVICGKVPRRQLEQVYGINLPPPASHEPPDRAPTAMEFLRTFAIKRGWSSANGLPDETRAGRTILKDYTAGKLVSAEMPPGFEPKNRAAMVEQPIAEANGDEAGLLQPEETALQRPTGAEQVQELPSSSGNIAAEPLGAADIDLMESLQDAGGRNKPRRPEHKFHKKPARSKGSRGKAEDDGGAYDGSAMRVGKHGGLVRVS